MGTKHCKRCDTTKLTTEFGKQSDKKDGLRAHCKPCRRESDKVYRIHNSDKIKQYKKKYKEENKEAIKIKDHQYYLDNKERISAYFKDRRVGKVRDALISYGSSYREENREMLREKNREYSKDNRAIRNANYARYRANKIQATPAWASDKYMKLWYEGAKIQEKLTGRKVHVDHIVPLKGANVCGLHCEDNMQWMFAEDNCSKGNKYE